MRKLLHSIICLIALATISLTHTATAQQGGGFSEPGFGNDSFGADKNPATDASFLVDFTTIKPGQKFTVALKLSHPQDWHSYYKNDGTGIAQIPKISWTLPEGFTAGDIIFPTPHKSEAYEMFSYTYDGVVYFLTEITAPADLKPGQTLSFSGATTWQICKVQCIQENFKINFSIKSAAQSAANPAYASELSTFTKHSLPSFKSPAGWMASATDKEGKISIKVTTAAKLPNDLVFYEYDGQIDVQKPTTITTSGKGFTLISSRNKGYEYTDKKPPTLKIVRGILHSPSTPLANGRHSIFISIPFGGELAALKEAAQSSLTTPSTPESNTPIPPQKKSAAESPQEQNTEQTTSKYDTTSPLKIISLNRITENGDVLDDQGEVIKPENLFMDDQGNLVNKEGTVTAKKQETTFLWAAILIFGGGLILNLMPCVFPVLGIKVLGFAQLAGDDPKKIKKHGLVFALGVVVSMWILAGILLAFREISGDAIAWGSQMKSPIFVGGMIILLTLFALNLYGVFEIGTSLTSVGGNLQTKKGYEGSFFSGMLTTLIATPCGAPLLAGAMAYTLQQTVIIAMILFTIFALGVAAPYIFLSFLPKLIDKLPQPGQWMITFKKAMALPLLATVVFLLSAFIKQTGEDGTIMMLWALVVFATAAFVYGTWSTPITKQSRRYSIGYALSSVIAISGGYLAYLAIDDKPALEQDIVTASDSQDTHAWKPWKLGIVDEYREKGSIIWVDYTANW